MADARGWGGVVIGALLCVACTELRIDPIADGGDGGDAGGRPDAGGPDAGRAERDAAAPDAAPDGGATDGGADAGSCPSDAVIRLGVPWTDLQAHEPGCVLGDDERVDLCMTAARRYCNARYPGCSAGGAGPLNAGKTGTDIACFIAPFREMTVRLTEITMRAGGITADGSTMQRRQGQTAVNRYCVSLGAPAGIGPTEHGADSATVICIPPDHGNDVAFSATRLGPCTPVMNPNTQACTAVADGLCRSIRWEGGIGPVEWGGTDFSVVCFGDPA